MLLNFVGDVSGLEAGISILSNELNFKLSSNGFTVQVQKVLDNRLEIIKHNDIIIIKFSEKICFFRALGLLIETLQEKNEFYIVEEPQFSTIGPMFDVSQGNAVIMVDNLKKILTKMAVMGLNMMMIYSEDSYEMKEEPFFGYMRSKYTFEELKELDDYADNFGIEMIPCIQALAHLIDVLKWDYYMDIRQNLDILLVGEEKTYEFIEKLIKTAIAPFRSKRIHLGMDEAWKLGGDNYLQKHGYKDKLDIILEHLKKVLEITSKYGLKPMIWSDAFFKQGYTRGCPELSKEIADIVPKDMQYIFWEYSIADKDYFVEILQKHKVFTPNPIYAPCIWNFMGYSVNYDVTIRSGNASMAACKQEGIKDVIITIWGDDTCESNIYSLLPGFQFYAEHNYSRELDDDKLKRRFKFCTGANFDDFMDLSQMDVIPEAPQEYVRQDPQICNPCKYLMWQDILLGLFDKNIRGIGLSEHYKKLGKKMKSHALDNGEYGFIFTFLEKVCSVLEIKAEIGLRITEAYINKDTHTMGNIAEKELVELSQRVADLRLYHQEQWMKINKPMGWEILDLRYGALLMRIDTSERRIKDYLNGKLSNIMELEQERQYFDGIPGLVTCYDYNSMVSASRLALTSFFTPWR